MVNGALRPQPSQIAGKFLIERARPGRRPSSMADPGPEMTAAAPAGPSVHAGLLSCATVALVALWIAAFEKPMDDLPGLVFFPLLPLTALALVGCSLWSVFLLTRMRRHGARFAGPFMVCALTFLALAYVPFTQLWLQGNFRWHLADRDRIVARVEAGEFTRNVAYNANMIALGDNEPMVSVRGNDIVVDQDADGSYVLFLTSRSIRHYFSGILHVPPGGDPAKFFEFADKAADATGEIRQGLVLRRELARVAGDEKVSIGRHPRIMSAGQPSLSAFGA
jgi:hypothetical protein